jgi:hypothetical protein
MDLAKLVRKIVRIGVAVLLFLISERILTAQSVATENTSESAGGSSHVESLSKPGGSSFFQRLRKTYSGDWRSNAAESADRPRRGLAAPDSSPPYPFSDWPYGGSPTLGAPDANGGPLMTALYTGENGKWWESSRVNDGSTAALT